MSSANHRLWRRRAGAVVFVFWAIAFIGSFVVFATTPSREVGATTGANRVLAFFIWQSAAGTLALVGWVVRSSLRSGSRLRKLLVLPVVLFAAVTAAVGALVIWAGTENPEDLYPGTATVLEGTAETVPSESSAEEPTQFSGQ